MKSLLCAVTLLIAGILYAGCAALVEPYKSPSASFHIAFVKREDKLLAIDGQSRLAAARGINSRSTRNSGKFTGLGGIDKWRYHYALVFEHCRIIFNVMDKLEHEVGCRQFIAVNAAKK